MAEERLIDDDKDRKYKIRINEKGEEELYIDETPEEEEPEETLGFEVPDFDGDDEEAAVMTPEQLAARDKAREEAEQKRLKNITARAAHAQKLIWENKFQDALYVLDEAERFGHDGKICALKVIALTQNYTDYSRAEDGITAAEGVENYAEDEVKGKFAPDKKAIKAQCAELKTRVESLKTDYEKQRGEREERYLKKRKISLIAFAITAVPMLVFAVLAAYFGSIMHAQMDHSNMIMCFVFIGVTALFFIATLFTAHRLWDSAKLLKMNKSTSSTKLGRELDECSAQLKFVEKIISVYGLNDDLS